MYFGFFKKNPYRFGFFFLAFWQISQSTEAVERVSPKKTDQNELFEPLIQPKPMLSNFIILETDRGAKMPMHLNLRVLSII